MFARKLAALNLSLLFLFSLSNLSAAAESAGRAVPSKTTGPVTSKPAAKAAEPAEASGEANARAMALAKAVADYKGRPDPATWDAVWRLVRDILTQPAAIKSPASAILKSYPSLSELSVKVIDGEGSRVWSFPKCLECQNAILQWNSVSVTVIPGGRRRPAREIVTAVPKAQVFGIPSSVVLYDAHLEHTATIGKDKKPHPGPVKALVLTGNSRSSGAVWMQAYKLADGVWVDSPDFFAGVPPFLTQNLVGKAYFENNDLVLTVGSLTPATKGGQTGYKIILHFVDSKFSLDPKSGEDGPAFVVLQFLQAVQSGHLDVAKGWLTDTRLVSNVKYAGLNKPTAQGFKLLAMANPQPPICRYRVITSTKNDLIVDLSKLKQQWVIKGIFIVPPDPLALKLLGGSSVTDKSADEKPAADSAQ